MFKDIAVKCGVDVSASACVYVAFSTQLLQQILIAICIVFVNVFFYPLFKCVLKWFNKKFKLGVSDEEIEEATKEVEEKIKDAVNKANDEQDGKK